ncbi:MAG: hypothetical protein K0R26_2917 [Bacteroidota bacterium]|jgi:hypothetical protein|nr:hypothetical protein [Bacteroidota bacterium]
MKVLNLFILIAVLQGILLSCAVPLRSFEKTPQPAPPDYSLQKYWSALPQKKDSADFQLTNYGIVNRQDEAKVDVFFITPTNYLKGFKWNVSVDDSTANAEADSVGCKLLASVFNESCKIYAPRYRTAIFYSYFASRKNSQKAFGLAYDDVKRAFLYYLKHYNHARPFIIASHSQGTDYGVRLIKEFLDKDTSLRKQFIEAYLVGRPVYDTTFKNIKVSTHPEEIGGFVTWNTVSYKTNTFFGDRVAPIIGVNPLSWKTDTSYVPAATNKGGLPFTTSRIDTGLVDAKLAPSGFLWVHKPDKPQEEYPATNTPYYHLNDYNFFYMNIRENVKIRIQSYFNANSKN